MLNENWCWKLIGFISLYFLKFLMSIEIKTVLLKEDSPINTTIEVPILQEKQFSNIKVIGDGFNQYFQLNKITNQIILIKPIDLEDSELCTHNQNCCDENFDCKFVFLIRIFDKQTSIFTYKLNILIEDVNDWTPHFKQKQYFIEFQEGPKSIGQKQLLPTAIDKDFSKKNRMITYHIQFSNSGKNIFQLLFDSNSQTPTLLLLNALDCEKKHHYLLDLIANDGAGKEGRVLIYVKVIDINEYAPEFSREIRNSFSIFESMVKRTIITQLQATDNDAYPNNNVTYKLESINEISSSNTFSIDLYSGEIQLISELDYEKVKSYSLIIIAYDSAPISDRKSSSLSITISILDVNDNYPELKFETENHKATIRENQPIATSVTILKINDRDSNQNGEVTCQLMKTENRFFLNRIWGKFYQVESNKVFDREEIDRYFINIICYDHGSPSLTTSVTLTVLIEDENDQDPQFVTHNFRFSVKENSPIQTIIKGSNSNNNNNAISKIQVIDQDIIGNLTFFIDFKNMLNNSIHVIQIDTYSGVLYVAGLIDRETTSEYRMRVCCNDTIHVVCTDIYVDVEDENDNIPFLLNDVHRISVEENTINYDKALLLFRPQDADATNTGFKISFDQSTNEEVLKYFKLDHYKLFLKKPLDREEISTFQFLIQIGDKHPHGDLQLFTTAKVFIKVTDQNDNSPKFIFPNSTHFSINVSCHEPLGHLIGKVSAFDPDYGDNGTIVYELIKIFPHKELNLFHVDRHTGEIFINNNVLVNEQFCRFNFILMISAKDLGDQQVNNLMYKKYFSRTFGKLQLTLLDIPRSYSAKITLITPRLILTVILSFSTLFLMCLLIAWALIIFRQRKRNIRTKSDENKCYYSMNLLNNNIIMDQKSTKDEDESQSETVTYIHREDIEKFDSLSEYKSFRPVSFCPAVNSNPNALILLNSKSPQTIRASQESSACTENHSNLQTKCRSPSSSSTSAAEETSSTNLQKIPKNSCNPVIDYEPIYVLRSRTICVPKRDSKNTDIYTTLMPHSSVVKFTPVYSNRNELENENDTYV